MPYLGVGNPITKQMDTEIIHLYTISPYLTYIFEVIWQTRKSISMVVAY